MSKFAIDEIFIDEAVNSSLLAVNSVGEEVLVLKAQ
jgi:hypothetical protein